MGHIKDFTEFVNESDIVVVGPVDIRKLTKYATAISICCNGEYGEVFYNQNENSIFVNLGDSSPFDSESLMYYMQDAIAADYNSAKQITVVIENECGPSGEGWKIVDPKSGTLQDWNGW